MIDSPLFAVEAQELLDQGKVQEAIDLCNEGLKVFPNYQAAVGILAQAYKQIGDDEKANQTLNDAIEKFPTSKSLGNLKKFDLELPKFIEKDVVDIKEMNSEEILSDLSKYEDVEDVEDVEDLEDDSGELDDVGFGDIAKGDEDINEEDLEFDFGLNTESDEDDSDEEYLLDLNIDNEAKDDSDIISNEDNIRNELDEYLIEENTFDGELEILDNMGFEEEINKYDNIDNISESDNDIVELDMSDKDLFGEWDIKELMPKFSYEFHLDTLPDLEFIDRFKGVQLELPIYFGNDSAKNTLELDTLAKNLEGAKIGPAGSNQNVEDGDFSELEKPKIATETLAKIYEEQDAFDEAIRIYEILAENQPEKEQYFSSKIEKLKNHIL